MVRQAVVVGISDPCANMNHYRTVIHLLLRAENMWAPQRTAGTELISSRGNFSTMKLSSAARN